VTSTRGISEPRTDWQGEATAFGQRDLYGTDVARLVGAATVPTAIPR
jgi:hypothetical protein